MFISAGNHRVRYVAFVLSMLTINLIDGVLVRSIADPGRRMIVAAGATFDVVVVVSALYYWMLVRPRIRAPGSVAAIAATGILRATFFYPHGTAATAVVAVLCEAGLIGYVISQVRRKIRVRAGDAGNTDPVEAIGAALSGVILVPGLARLIAAELGILYYALFSWRSKPHVPADAQSFSIHERAGQADVLRALPILCALEIVPAHLILKHGSPALAWIITGLSFYGMIWLVGLARAFRLRPVLVGRDYLLLRYGLLFQLCVPKAAIARVRRAESGDGKFAVPRRSEPTLCIELVEVLDAAGPLGKRKRMTRVAFTPDDAPAFERALAGLTGRRSV